MVRTQSRPARDPIDSSRVLAYSAAIALHALAAGVLLVPMAYQANPSSADTPTQVRWVQPTVVPVNPPRPPPPLPVPAAPTAPRAPALPQVVQPPAIPVFATEAVLHLPETANTEQTTATPSSIDAAPPTSGAQLQYIRAPAPAYPHQALLAGAQGTVMLRVLVDESGKPVQVSIERSSGHRSLDAAARTQVLRHWRFQPALENGQAVQAIGMVPVSFNLQ